MGAWQLREDVARSWRQVYRWRWVEPRTRAGDQCSWNWQLEFWQGFNWGFCREDGDWWPLSGIRWRADDDVADDRGSGIVENIIRGRDVGMEVSRRAAQAERGRRLPSRIEFRLWCHAMRNWIDFCILWNWWLQLEITHDYIGHETWSLSKRDSIHENPRPKKDFIK